MENFFSTNIILENEIALLKPFTKDVFNHADDIYNNMHDADIPKYTASYIENRTDLEKYINWTLAEKEQKISYPFIIIDKKTNRIVGSTRYGNISFDRKKIEIGWTWIAKKYRGTTFNKACKYELLKFAFEILNFRRVQFMVDEENVRSQKAVLKLGATQEGILRYYGVDKQGNSRNSVCFSIIANEWLKIKEDITGELTFLNKTLMKLKLFQIDAFTDKAFSGNPAAICPLDKWLSDELLQKVAMENNLAETGFFVKQNDEYIIRWFTPTVEVDLCGHATLAAAHVLFKYYNYPGNEICFNSPRSGILKVSKKENLITLNFPIDDYRQVDLSEELVAGFNIKPIEAFKGKTDYMLVFESEDQIKKNEN